MRTPVGNRPFKYFGQVSLKGFPLSFLQWCLLEPLMLDTLIPLSASHYQSRRCPFSLCYLKILNILIGVRPKANSRQHIHFCPLQKVVTIFTKRLMTFYREAGSGGETLVFGVFLKTIKQQRTTIGRYVLKNKRSSMYISCTRTKYQDIINVHELSGNT